MKTPYEMTTVLEVIWFVIILLAVCFLVAAIALLQVKNSLWYQCSWCRHWFTHGGKRQLDKPKDLEGATSHGMCRCCKDSQKAELQRRNLLRQGEFYPRMHFDGDEALPSLKDEHQPRSTKL